MGRRRLPVPSRRFLAAGAWAVAVAVALLIVWMLATIESLSSDVAEGDTARGEDRAAIEELRDANTAQDRALREANRRCREADGCTPVPTPPVVVEGDPGATGPTGATGQQGARGPGPSAAQVAVAVAAYCSGGACSGPGPSEAQVAAAVTTYCDRNGQCRGPEGDTGASGSAGSDGKAGERGPGPTAEQVAAAVADYCSTGACVGAAGPTGATGDTGAAGAPGRGIDSVSCDSAAPITLTITYSDGTSVEVSCGLANSLR